MYRTKVPNVAFEVWLSRKVNLHLNEKHVLFLSREISGISQNKLFGYNQRKKQSRAQKDNLERTQRHFGKFVFSFRWNRPIFFGRFVRKSSKQLHTIQNNENHFSKKKSKAIFLSIRYRKSFKTQVVKSWSTKRSLRKLAQTNPNTAVEQK